MLTTRDRLSSSERRIATKAMLNYAYAIARGAARAATSYAIPPSVGLAVVALVLVVGGGLVFGDTFWGGKANHVMTMSRAGPRIEFSMFDYNALQNGYLCQNYAELEAGQSIVAIKPDGRTTFTFNCPRLVFGSSCGACTKIQQGSEAGWRADVRRFMVRNLVRETFGNFHIAAVLSFGVAAAALVFAIVFTTLAPTVFLRLIFKAFHRLFRTLRRTAAPPRLAPWIQEGNADGASPILCQLSDLHFTAGTHVPFEMMGSPNSPDSVELSKRFEAAMAGALHLNPKIVALTGDLTDSGHSSEWEALRTCLAKIDIDATEIVVTPGNHDIQFLVEHRLDGNRHAFSRVDESTPNHRDICIAEIALSFPGLSAKFPTLHSVESEEGTVDIIALDSCRYESNWLLSNAIGELGKQQIEQVSTLIKTRKSPTIVILHHHVGWSDTQSRDVRDVLMCAVDGRDLLNLLAEHSMKVGVPVLVLHGHKHMHLSGRYQHKGGEIFVHGCPSSTLGNCKTADAKIDGFQYFCAVYLTDGTWSVDLHCVGQEKSSYLRSPAH